MRCVCVGADPSRRSGWGHGAWLNGRSAFSWPEPVARGLCVARKTNFCCRASASKRRPEIERASHAKDIPLSCIGALAFFSTVSKGAARGRCGLAVACFPPARRHLRRPGRAVPPGLCAPPPLPHCAGAVRRFYSDPKAKAFVLLCPALAYSQCRRFCRVVAGRSSSSSVPAGVLHAKFIPREASPNARQTSHRRPLCLSCRFYPAIAGHRNPFTCQLRRAIWHWIGPSRSRNLRPQCEAQSGAPPRTAPPTAAAPCSPFSSSQSSQMTQSGSA